MRLFLALFMAILSNLSWAANPQVSSGGGPIVGDYYGYYSLLSQVVRDEEASKRTTRGVSYIYFWEPPTHPVSHLVACVIDNNLGMYEFWTLKLRWTKGGESKLPTIRNYEKLKKEGLLKVFKEAGVLSDGKGGAEIVAKLDSLTFPANSKPIHSSSVGGGLPDSVGLVSVCDGRVQVLSVYASDDVRRGMQEILEKVHRLAN